VFGFLPHLRKKRKATFVKHEGQKPVNAGLRAAALSELSMEKMGKILSETGPRRAGSEEAKMAASLLAEEFGKFSDDVAEEEFSASEEDYYGIFKVIAASAIPVFLFSFIGLPIVSLAIAAYVTARFVKGFLLSMGTNPWPFESKTMTNVHAKMKCSGERKRTVVLTSHHDSAKILKDSKIYAYALLSYLVLILFIAVYAFIDIVSLDFWKPDALTLVRALLHLPLLLFSVVFCKCWKMESDEYALGAGDNLISSSLLTELAHYFSWKERNGEGLKSTELIFASFDGEECGQKGSDAWFKKHKAEFAKDVRAINIDSPYSEKSITLITKDQNGTVPLSVSLAEDLASIAGKIGLKVEMGALPLFTGGTDAVNAARNGIEAVTIVGIPISGRERTHYHTAEDTPDKISKKAVESVITLLIKYIEGFDGMHDEEGKKASLEDEGISYSLTRKRWR